ncbi:MAG: hypothetical protein ACJ8ER_04690 [Allosphingosinicella sp.]
MTAQPGLAAPLGSESGPVRGHVAAFAGASFTLPLGSGRHERASARLQLSPVASFYDGGSGRLVRQSGAGLELGLTSNGTPDLRLAGYGPAELKRTLGFKGSTGYVIVGGAVLVVLLLAAVASASPKPGPRPGDFGP